MDKVYHYKCHSLTIPKWDKEMTRFNAMCADGCGAFMFEFVNHGWEMAYSAIVAEMGVEFLTDWECLHFRMDNHTFVVATRKSNKKPLLPPSFRFLKHCNAVSNKDGMSLGEFYIELLSHLTSIV